MLPIFLDTYPMTDCHGVFLPLLKSGKDKFGRKALKLKDTKPGGVDVSILPCPQLAPRTAHFGSVAKMKRRLRHRELFTAIGFGLSPAPRLVAAPERSDGQTPTRASTLARPAVILHGNLQRNGPRCMCIPRKNSQPWHSSCQPLRGRLG